MIPRTSIVAILSIILLCTPLLAGYVQGHVPIPQSDMKGDKEGSISSYAEIVFYSYAHGQVQVTKKVVPVYEALQFVSMGYDTSESLNLAYEMLPSPKETMLSNTQANDKACSLLQRSQPFTLKTVSLLEALRTGKAMRGLTHFNFLCSLKCKLLGLGFVLGTHAMIPTVGIDLLGLFGTIGTIDMTNGFLDDVHLSGFHFWGFVGFAGNFVFTLIPMFPGPIIILNGVTLACFAV